MKAAAGWRVRSAMVLFVIWVIGDIGVRSGRGRKPDERKAFMLGGRMDGFRSFLVGAS